MKLSRRCLALFFRSPMIVCSGAGTGVSVPAPRRVPGVPSLLGLALLLAPLPGCQNIQSTTFNSQVRIIDASPDAPGLDVYQGSGILAYNLGLGTVTSYVPLSQGAYAINVDAAGTHQQLVSASGTFLAGSQYTVLIGNYSNSLQELILKDQTQPAPAGQAAVRFLDQSTRGGSVDLYLVPAGSTIASARAIQAGVAFGANTGYLNLPAGTYTLVALPTGTIPAAGVATSYTGPAITYAAGSAKTIVIIDQPLATTSGVQVIVANDYDPLGATS